MRGGYLIYVMPGRPERAGFRENGASMKKMSVFVLVVVSLLACSVAQGAPPIFKEKKFFGPIPYNSLSLSVGFLDGAEFQVPDRASRQLGEGPQRERQRSRSSLPPRTARLSYERQLTPNHFFKGSASLSYIKHIERRQLRRPVSRHQLQLSISERTLKVYLLTFEAGFSYYFTPPEPQRFSPYVGARLRGGRSHGAPRYGEHDERRLAVLQSRRERLPEQLRRRACIWSSG